MAPGKNCSGPSIVSITHRTLAGLLFKSKGRTYPYAWRGGPRITANPLPSSSSSTNAAMLTERSASKMPFHSHCGVQGISEFPKGLATQKETVGISQ
jgi:hypothetical protein